MRTLVTRASLVTALLLVATGCAAPVNDNAVRLTGTIDDRTTPDDTRRRVLISREAVGAMGYGGDLYQKDWNVVPLTVTDAEALARRLHEETGVCGAAADVTRAYAESGYDDAIFARRRISGCRKITAKTFPKSTGCTAKKSLLDPVDTGGMKDELDLLLKACDDRYACPKTGTGCYDAQCASGHLEDHIEDRLAQVFPGGSIERVKTPGRWQDSFLVEIPGTDTAAAALVIGAHLDSWDEVPGADDNGSGTVVLLELLRLIRDENLSFRRTIYVAFFAAEEVNLLGSAAVVDHLDPASNPVRAMLNLDMTGAVSDKEMYFLTRGDTCHENEQLTALARAVAGDYLGIAGSDIGTDPCGACSDHYYFTEEGVPSVYVSEGKSGSNSTMHTSSDTADKVLEHRLGVFTRFALAFAIELADLEDCQ